MEFRWHCSLVYFLDEWIVFAPAKPASICILTWSWTLFFWLSLFLRCFFSEHQRWAYTSRFLVIYQLNTFAILLLLFLGSCLSISYSKCVQCVQISNNLIEKKLIFGSWIPSEDFLIVSYVNIECLWEQ